MPLLVTDVASTGSAGVLGVDAGPSLFEYVLNLLQSVEGGHLLVSGGCASTRCILATRLSALFLGLLAPGGLALPCGPSSLVVLMRLSIRAFFRRSVPLAGGIAGLPRCRSGRVLLPPITAVAILVIIVILRRHLGGSLLVEIVQMLLSESILLMLQLVLLIVWVHCNVLNLEFISVRILCARGSTALSVLV